MKIPMMTMSLILTVLAFVSIVAPAAQQDGTAPVAQDATHSSQSKDDADANCNAANTQMEINQCFGNAYQKADKDLTKLYSRIAKKQDAPGLVRLHAAQHAWLKYRDAHCSAAAAVYHGGSIEGSVRSGCLMRLTRTRIDELQHVYSTSR